MLNWVSMGFPMSLDLWYNLIFVFRIQCYIPFCSARKKVSIFFSERLSSMLTKTARNLTRIFGVLLVTGMLLPRHHTHYGVMWESTCWPSGQCITSLESKFTPLGKKTFEKLSARPRWDWNFFSKKLRLIWARAVHVKTVLKYWSLTKCSLITCIH